MTLGYILNSSETPFFLEEADEVFRGKPTLIVGWKKAKELYPEMSLRDWKINETTYWTLESSDDRMKMQKDILAFKKVCLDFYLGQFSYEYFDLFLKSPSELVFSPDSVVLSRHTILYIKELKSIMYFPLELSNSMGYNLLSELIAAGVEIQTEVENIFGVEDRFLVCFL
jgi:hypothetical protein